MTPEQFIREYETSTSTHGLEHTLGLIADDAVYWFSNGSCHPGKEAVEKAIRSNFEAIEEETYQISDVQWLAKSPDIAVCIYRYEWSGLLFGEPASGGGRGTCVLVRSGDSWNVVHEHLSQGEHRVA